MNARSEIRRMLTFSLLGVVGLTGCTQSESRIPDSIRSQAKEATRNHAAAIASKVPPPSPVADTISRFTVRPFEDWSMTEAAAMALSRIGAPAVLALTESLRHPQATTRIQAADTLARIGPDASAAVPALVAALDDPDLRVRKSAARALGQIGPAAADAVPALMRSLDQPRTDDGRSENR